MTLDLKEMGKPDKKWTLGLHPAHLTLAEGAERPYVIMRGEVMKSFVLVEGMKAVAATKPVKLNFQLTPEGAMALAEWIGKPVLALHYMRRRYAWVLPVAILWMLGSLPVPGEAANGGKPFDLIGFSLGLILTGSWAMARWRPHPVLFLVDSLWFLMLAFVLLKDVFVDGRSKGWLVLVVLSVWLVVSGVKHYQRFRGIQMTRA